MKMRTTGTHPWLAFRPIKLETLQFEGKFDGYPPPLFLLAKYGEGRYVDYEVGLTDETIEYFSKLHRVEYYIVFAHCLELWAFLVQQTLARSSLLEVQLPLDVYDGAIASLEAAERYSILILDNLDDLSSIDLLSILPELRRSSQLFMYLDTRNTTSVMQDFLWSAVIISMARMRASFSDVAAQTPGQPRPRCIEEETLNFIEGTITAFMYFVIGNTVKGNRGGVMSLEDNEGIVRRKITVWLDVFWGQVYKNLTFAKDIEAI